MVPFFVQIKCKLGQSYKVANALAEAEIASEIYSTAGDYDLLVKFYVDEGTDIGHFVNEKVQVIPGIQDTHTIITFKAFGGAEEQPSGSTASLPLAYGAPASASAPSMALSSSSSENFLSLTARASCRAPTI